MTQRGLLIFDLDGTLFQSDMIWLPAVRLGFQDHALDEPDNEMIRSFIGKPAANFRDWIHSQYPDQATELVTTIERRELELIPGGKLYPEIWEVLVELRSFVAQMAICTNGAKEYVERVINEKGIGIFFDTVRYRQSANDNKPAMVSELLKSLTSRPAIVIGDRYDDIYAAHQNNLVAIATEYGYGTSEELQHADFTARQPECILSLVRSYLNNDS